MQNSQRFSLSLTNTFRDVLFVSHKEESAAARPSKSLGEMLDEDTRDVTVGLLGDVH